MGYSVEHQRLAVKKASGVKPAAEKRAADVLSADRPRNALKAMQDKNHPPKSPERGVNDLTNDDADDADDAVQEATQWEPVSKVGVNVDCDRLSTPPGEKHSFGRCVPITHSKSSMWSVISRDM